MRPPIVSSNVRVRHPDLFEVGEGSIVDDFCYFSTRVVIGRYSHVASGCTIAGGRDRLFALGDFSSVSAGVRIWCTSDDFARDIVTILPEGCEDLKRHVLSGDVVFERLTAVGANSVIMPGTRVPEGTVIGALSYVPPGFELEPWAVYAGVPVRRLRARERDAVLARAEELERRLRQRRE